MLKLVRKFMKWLVKQDKEKEIRRRIMEYTKNVLVQDHYIIFSTSTTSQEDRAIFNYLRGMQLLRQYQIIYISEKKFNRVKKDPQRYEKYLKICIN